MINLSRNKNICCGLKKGVAKSRGLVYIEQRILALLLVFMELTTCHATNAAVLDPHQANQPISALEFLNPQKMFLLRDNLITQGEKRETSTKTCNKTMLRDKLRVFVSRISPPTLRLGCLFVPGKCIGYKEEPRGSPLWPRRVSLDLHVNFLLNVTGPASSIAANATNRRNSETKGLRSRQQLYKDLKIPASKDRGHIAPQVFKAPWRYTAGG